MDPQLHPLLHFFVRMKPTSTNIFLQVAKNVEVTRGKIWAVRRMLKCFPAKSLKLIAHEIGSMGTGVIMQKDDSVRQLSGRFDFMTRRSALRHQQTDHTSLLLFCCLYCQCWMNPLYTRLTSRAIKKQLCGPVRFHFACLLPYRWQYRYVTTVLPAFIRNLFYGGCSVLI